MWIMWISAKKRKKTQAEDVEQFVYNFGINIPEIEKVVLNLEVKKRPPDMKILTVP